MRVLAPCVELGVWGNGAEHLPGWCRPSVDVPGVLLLELLLEGGGY